jgi:hypothetical protein
VPTAEQIHGGRYDGAGSGHGKLFEMADIAKATPACSC